MRDNTRGLVLLRQALNLQERAEAALGKREWGNASLLFWHATQVAVQALDLVSNRDACKLTVKVLGQLNLGEDFANQCLVWEDLGHAPEELLAKLWPVVFPQDSQRTLANH